MPTSNVNDITHVKSHYYTSPPLTVVVTIIIIVFLLIGFFTLYFCKCFFQKILNSRLGPRRSPNHSASADTNEAAPYPGLDSTIVDTFPTFTYSSVKEYRRAKYSLECAICLLEFEDDHVIRLVKLCCHVFHQDCIDLWFDLHKTCPVCRRNLEVLFGEGTPACTPSRDEEDSRRDSVTITIEDDPEEKKGSNHGEKGSRDRNDFIARYNTTGHSIFTSIEEEDRFTLRLPDHVTQELIKANHWPKHLHTSGESKRNVYIVGEGSDGNIKNVKVPPIFLDNG